MASRPSPIADSFALAGPSTRPDPAFNAYRPDLADVALAGTVISSHYAEPLARKLIHAAVLRAEASDGSEAVAELARGATLWMLDCTRGWAWGYGGADRRVGYVEADAVGF